MASTNFSYGTLIQSTWLNDVNAAVYTTIPSLKPVAYSGSKADVGLGNVDNTSDVNKPISTATQTALNTKQDANAKDASGGYAGLTGYNYNFKNVAGTFTSVLTNTNTASRTYTFPDKSGTVAMVSDIPATPPSPAMVLVAQATVTTAVANIDFLNTFTSTYDRYVVEAEALSPSVGSNQLQVLFAKAGVVDTSANYIGPVPDAGSGSAGAFFPILTPITGVGNDVTMTLDIRNVNNATASVKTMGLRAASGSNIFRIREGYYAGANTVSGFRLYWNAGANFITGTVRVYGITNN